MKTKKTTIRISGLRHPAMTYLTALSPAEADRLLIAIEALKEWLWDVHGPAIEDFYGCDEASFFGQTHTKTPNFLKEKKHEDL